MPIHDLIAAARDTLTRSELKVAGAVAADPTLVAFETVAELAARASTSRPTVVRFAAKLGFGGYADLQSWVRQELARRLSRPSERVRRPSGPIDSVRGALHEAVDQVFHTLGEERLAALAAPLAEARRVLVLTGETSTAGARVLHSGLSMARPDVVLIEEHSAGRDMTGAGPGDAAAVIDFPRYRRHAVTAARTLREMGVQIVAITDGPLSPLAALTQTWCELRIPAVGPFDSSVPAVAAAELLVAAVVRRLGDDARDRIDRLESLWQATDTYLEYTPRLARDR